MRSGFTQANGGLRSLKLFLETRQCFLNSGRKIYGNEGTNHLNLDDLMVHNEDKNTESK